MLMMIRNRRAVYPHPGPGKKGGEKKKKNEKEEKREKKIIY